MPHWARSVAGTIPCEVDKSCPTGPGVLPELFPVKWTKADARRHP
nr:hypothetical protein [Tanacetum cinerariifolium]